MAHRFSTAVALIVALQAGGIAGAAPAKRESVRSLLRAKDAITLTAADWQKLGDDVDVYLVEAASDAKLAYGARQRAIAGLGAVRGERARAFLHELASSRSAAAPLLGSAVQAYATGFGKDDPAGAQKLSSELLAHSDWLVRRGAVRALGELGTDEARAALRAHAARETNASVRASVSKALGQAPKAF